MSWMDALRTVRLVRAVLDTVRGYDDAIRTISAALRKEDASWVDAVDQVRHEWRHYGDWKHCAMCQPFRPEDDPGRPPLCHHCPLGFPERFGIGGAPCTIGEGEESFIEMTTLMRVAGFIDTDRIVHALEARLAWIERRLQGFGIRIIRKNGRAHRIEHVGRHALPGGRSW